MTVRVDGATPTPVSGTVVSNAGTGPSVANSWNVRLTDGTDIGQISTASAAIGNQLLVSTGSLTTTRSLSAVTANATGTAVDSASAKNNFTMAVVTTGTLTGTVTLELSLNNTNWFSSTETVVVSAAGTDAAFSIGRPARYARAVLSGAAGTGTISADITGA